jgi:DNA processing protein
VDDVEPRLARVALACLLEPGTRALHELVTERGPGGALAALLEGSADPALVDAAGSRIALGDPLHAAENLLNRTRRLGARVVVPEDTEWPRQLADLGRISRGDGSRIDRDTFAPTCLWVRGEPPLTQVMERAVAIVGSRASTSYGNHIAMELAYGLAGRGWTVVSGGAYGIDASAHRGALSGAGVTAAVLACGVDRPYPAGHSSLFERISDGGLLISEWPLGADPHRYRFLVRNRVIAALTRGTVMVEANARSGARQTLGRAALLRRATLVVPGPVSSAMSVGCHQAIRAGARLVTSYEEVLEEVGRIGDDLAPLPQGPEDPRDRLGTDLARVLDAVPYRRGADAAQVAAVAGVPLRDALRALPNLQTAGFVKEYNGLWTGVRSAPAAGAPTAPTAP